MPDREQKLLTYRAREREVIEILKSEGLNYADSSFIWQTLQLEFECTDIPTKLVLLDLSVSQIAEIILRYKDLYGPPLCEFAIYESYYLK
jgi:hypothetical protein